MDANTSNIGVLLANTGSPTAPTAPAVREYLKEFLSNPRIVPVNPILWWIILRLFVLPKRGESSAEKYRAIWTDEGSPLLVNADNLAARLQELYRSQGLPITVKAAMSIGEPSIREAIAEFRAEGINRLVSIPLYPQSAFSTCKIAEDAIRATLKQMGWRPFIRYISGYSDNPLYVKAIASSVLAAGFKPGSTDKLVYSFHSVPLNDIERGDTYELQVGSSCLAISNELKIERRQWTIAYQCRFDSSRTWLSPFTQDVLAREARLEPHRVFIVCPNFSLDCLETLYDIEHMLKPGYMRQLSLNGFDADESSFIYVPCLNDSPQHVRLIADLVARTIM